MKKFLISLLVVLCGISLQAQNLSRYNLVFDSLPARWDEALPLGNGMLGCLIWQKGSNLRLSLDRADLWDERPALDLSKFNFKWVEQQVLKKQYDTVQQLGDNPYDALPYPTKIPAAAFEFDIASLGRIKTASLDIATATAKIVWENGVQFQSFIHAVDTFGVFRFIHVPANMLPKLIAPNYATEKDNHTKTQSLTRLGYKKGVIRDGKNYITYVQEGSNGFRYEVSVHWQYHSDTLDGVWSIASYSSEDSMNYIAENLCAKKSVYEYNALLQSHLSWWKNYWAQSSVSLPDTLLQKQYYLDMYKFGCVARKGVPPITLQAVWTADNDLLPPWKGDIHNDLNTELSYWCAFTANHLTEASSFTDWLWITKPENKKYTKQFFQVDGLNVPGVETLSGAPMGGWIQYSLSPTVSAWLSQYFYWQWKYSMDKKFLSEKAYPYLHDVAAFLSNITVLKNGKRTLPLSSSPEYHDNDISAWFVNGNTNYDLALMKFVYGAAAELATAIGKNQEALQWKKELAQLPQFAVDSTGLMIAPNEDRTSSHRHHSNLMAIYPLGLLHPEYPKDKSVIDSSLHWLQRTGTKAWVGYSFCWAACLYARAEDGNASAKMLRIFAEDFCSPNSFHLNGDQKGEKYSDYTYRPFTLEGNFAFAQAVHEMLLQSYSGVIKIFPAVPDTWKNAAFSNLRTEGAFLISAKMTNGKTSKIKIVSEKGGIAEIKLPSFSALPQMKQKQVVSIRKMQDDIIEVSFQKGGELELLSIDN